MGLDPEMGSFWVMALVSSIFSLVIGIGIIVLIILGVRWLMRQDRIGGDRSSGSTPRPDGPLEVLRQRYARGEIDDEEYERRRKMLSGG